MEKQKNIPQLRFREFEGEWGKKKIGEIGSIQMCKRIFAHQTTESGDVPFYKIGTLGSLPDAYISKDLFNEYKSRYNYPQKGHTLITCSGTIGKCIQFDGHDSYYQDSNIIWIDNNDVTVFNDFLFLLLSNYKWGKLNSTTITRIYTNDLKVLQFYFPSLPEQQKIASFFTAIDQKISQLKLKLTLLEQYKKGVMQKIFSQQIRFKADKGQEFQKWEKKKLGKVCDCLDNFRQPLNDAERQKMQGDIPYWGANNIMDYINDYIFDETIVLLAEDGGNFNEYMTRPIANISYGKCWVNNHTHVLRGKSNLLNEFLFYSLVHKDITGFVSGGTRKKLTKGEMLKIPINTPFLTEQTKIANFLSAIDDKIIHTRKQIEKAEVWKKGLMQQMFV